MPNIRRQVYETLSSAGNDNIAALPDTGTLTVICAPTGYDKTAHAKKMWPQHAHWLDVNAGGEKHLWRRITEALAQQAGTAGEGGGDAQAALALAATLTTPVTLIIDDYHLATNQETDLNLASLAAHPHINLVVIGRNVGLLDSPLISGLVSGSTNVGLLDSPLISGLVSGSTNVRVINTSHLAVNKQEMKQLPCADALETTEGWPLALRAALAWGQETPSNETPSNKTNAAATANLEAFALDYLSTLGPLQQDVTLAAAQLDAISPTLAAVSVDATVEEVEEACQSLAELGILVRTPSKFHVEYRCHEALRSTLRRQAVAGSAFEERRKLYVARGKEVEATAPYTAFRLYCAAKDFAAAEAVLAPNFTTITDEGEVPYTLLRQLTEDTLLAYPTLAGARVFLERQQLDVSVEAIERTRDTWAKGLAARLPQGVHSTGVPLHIPLVIQLLASARLSGRTVEAQTILTYLEEQGVSGDAGSAALREIAGALPNYYREAAMTALTSGDFRRARRFLASLDAHADWLISLPYTPLPPAGTRTVTDTMSGARWKMAAKSELAFLEMIEGDMRASATLVAEMDALVAQTGQRAPGMTWAGAEMARTHLSAENVEGEVSAPQGRPRLEDFRDRMELWQILALTEAVGLLRRRGPLVALTHLQALLYRGRRLGEGGAPGSPSATSGAAGRPALHAPGGRLPPVQAPARQPLFTRAFEVSLHTILGKLAEAKRLIRGLPESPAKAIEEARLALFRGDDVDALVAARGIADPGTTVRQRVDRDAIWAVAAWGCGEEDEALGALARAIRVARECGLEPMLSGVPFDLLEEVAHALDTTASPSPDAVAMVEATPGPVRVRRYEGLTPMELKTLRTVAEHRSNSDAAEELFVTPGTVKKHLAAVYRKLGVGSRDAAILQAITMGIM